MNWFKRAQPNPNDDPLGKRVFDNYGVWQYPFNMVKHDTSSGWYINWFEFQGGIPDIDQVEIGQKVADQQLNMTPYWEVNFVDGQKGIIFLTPIEPNPFLTGVGAGGAPITEHDMQVHSGEFEKKYVDSVLEALRNKTATDPRDVAYILKGTVPVHVGPNGSQGGWYSPSAGWSTRGGQQGMTAQEIMMEDAKALQKMGFLMPKAALDGSMDPHTFGDFVNSNGDDLNPEYKSELENYEDPKTCVQFITNHPQPSVKKRNYKALLNIFDPDPRTKIKELWKKPVPEGDRGWHTREYDRLWDEYRDGKFRNKEMEPIVKQMTTTIASLNHPSQQKLNFDVYWHLKEKAIDTIIKFGWKDLLPAFENAFDKDNRRWVAIAYSKLGDPAGVQKMMAKEREPETRRDMEYWLRKAQEGKA